MISSSARRFTRADPVLFVHFFRGFFESDLLSIRDQLVPVFASIAALLASFGLILPVLFNHKYRVLNALPTPALYREAALADKLMFICISMDLTAIATLLNWQSLFPDLKDFLILTPLPIDRRQLFRSKFLALLLFVTLLILSLNILPSFSMTAIMSGRWQESETSFLKSLLTIFSFFAACSLAAYFVFFTLLAVQGLLLNLLPSAWFASCSFAVQGILLIVACAALPLTLWISGLHAFIGKEPAALAWLPPAWFLGLGEVFLRRADPVFEALADRAVWGLSLAVVSASLLYLAAYARRTDQLSKTPGARQITNWRILDLTARAPEEAAILSFTCKSLFRSRVHKLLAAAIVGACLALVLDGFASLLINGALHRRVIAHSALLSVACSTPLIAAFFLLTGLLFIFSIPIDLRANWIFRLSEAPGRHWPMLATEKILLTLVVLPVSALTVICLAAWTGFEETLLQAAFVFLMCLVLAEMLLWNWNRIPFTCPYLPGKRNIIQSALVFTVALSLFAYTATSLELRLRHSRVAVAVLLATLLIVVLFMHVQRRKSWTGGLAIRFDEAPEPEVRTLDLAGE